jgi:hypothetical protein
MNQLAEAFSALFLFGCLGITDKVILLGKQALKMKKNSEASAPQLFSFLGNSSIAQILRNSYS